MRGKDQQCRHLANVVELTRVLLYTVEHRKLRTYIYWTEANQISNIYRHTLQPGVISTNNWRSPATEQIKWWWWWWWWYRRTIATVNTLISNAILQSISECQCDKWMSVGKFSPNTGQLARRAICSAAVTSLFLFSTLEPNYLRMYRPIFTKYSPNGRKNDFTCRWPISSDPRFPVSQGTLSW